MDTEALQVPLEIFLATHHPVRMTRQDLQTGVATRAYSEKAFLEDFLRPASFAFVPVLGEAGTGKSHLVRWLYANIPETRNRRVLLIPKLGTNLRSVIERILGDLRGERFDALRKRLREETDSLTPGRAREMLLNNLAMEIGPHGTHGNLGLTEGQEYCVQALPALLQDPFFRAKHFLVEGGIIDRLATHILGRSDRVERLTERRQFTEADLTIELATMTSASADAQAVNSDLKQPGILQEVVRWLNRNLDAAIASLLHLRGEGLMELMTEVREVLAEQNAELVILIEDFAKLQGIEHQLLEALLVRSDQPGLPKKLCGIRTALACTSGYFGAFKETVLQRATFSVNLDVDTQTTSEMEGQGDIQLFVSRYLNAARQSTNALKEWHQEALTGDEDSSTPPNACEGCPHLDGCHRAFGESHGIGLYPFNAMAIHRMMDRASPGRFVPRLLIKDVLKHTLEMYTGDLAAGRFPSPGLRAHFSGGKAGLSIELIDKLRQRDRVNADRREVLLEFWSKGGKEIVDLDPVIHEAFDLPVMGVAREVTPAPPTAPDGLVIGHPTGTSVVHPGPVAPPPLDLKDTELSEQLAQLSAWMNGGPLPEKLVHTLRPHLHTAIVGHGRWDPALLLMGFFSGEKEPFQPRSINFRRQSVQYSVTALPVEIPEKDTPEDFHAAAVALDGLLRFDRHGHWGFPGGARYLRVFTSQLDRWTLGLLARIQAPTESSTPFDPVPAAVELLALGSRLAGRPAFTKAGSVEEVVNALFSDWSAAGEFRGPKWKELMKVLANHRQKLQLIVVSRTGCTKGGARNARILDGVRIVQPLGRLLKDWRPREVLPEDLKGDLDAIKKVRQKVDALLDAALTEEQERYLAWQSRVTEAVGPDADWKELLAELRTTVTKARDAGVFVGGNPNDLEEAVRRVESLSPGAGSLLSALGRLRAQESGRRIVELSRDHQTGMSAIDTFIERAQRFLEGSTHRVNSDLTNIRAAGGQELEGARDSITTALEAMEKLAEELKRCEG